MTDSDKTLIAALLDRSGSMETSKTATEDGWRELINEQRLQPGRCEVTLAQFDTAYELVYPPTPIQSVPDFELVPRGMTALLDSVGRFITEVGQRLSALPDDDRPGQVICMIMTDGMENSSREWGWDSVRELIEHATHTVELAVRVSRVQHRRDRDRIDDRGVGRGLDHL